MEINIPQSKADADFLPIAAVAKVLNMSRQKVYLMVGKNQLPVHLFGGTKRVSRQDLEIFIKDSKS